MKRIPTLCLMIAFMGMLPIASAQKIDAYGYFSTRLERINDQLHLTNDQQEKLKPLIEQETSLMGQVYQNPVLSQKQKLKKYWSIIGATNNKIRPMLTPDQLPAFENVQKSQKQKYNDLLEQAKKGS